ncbi:type IV secretion system DNA-binding domain-containing protein [Deferribacterales bacterium Es71-Z0220]|uniref:type IV secretory system conjugative DNA transfer family protein n=1 Tax=Deferrivibrio essentukiensis TaxID=2880922 RepID=UPI001F6126ED|nr:TraM recognition domain-containing protein [Deferrivibrio essentukiensis]MCB4204529.1 type IV secretion system DNA-binding domain-containing protein [Deferrivibrio essentukiensis]
MSYKIIETEKLKNFDDILKKRRALFVANTILTVGTLNTPLSFFFFLTNLIAFKYYKKIKNLKKEELQNIDSKGDIFFGSATLYNKNLDILKTKTEIDYYFSYNDLTKHTLILGTTGSGKTTAFINIIGQHVDKGGGLIFVDGKADVDIQQKIIAIAQKQNREDDLFILNFISNQKTNTINILSGSSIEMKEVLTNLIVPEGVSGDNQYFYDNALSLLQIALSCLVYLRDIAKQKINIQQIISITSNLNNLVNLYKNNFKGIDVNFKDEKINKTIKQLTVEYFDAMGHVNYESNDFNEETIRQHQYAFSTLKNGLEILSSQFGHIFNSDDADIDLKEIIKNNSILYVALPALEKSNETLKKLGKLIITMLRQVTAAQLTNLDLRTEIPFLLMLDEFGAYSTSELTTIMQQARSLNVAVIVAMQELTSLKNRDEDKLLDSVLSNTNTQIFLKAKEPNTLQKIEQLAGKEKVFERTEYTANSVDVLKNITSYEKTYKATEQNRISTIHLQEFSNGQCIIIKDGKIFYCKSQYLHVDTASTYNFKLNKMFS